MILRSSAGGGQRDAGSARGRVRRGPAVRRAGGAALRRGLAAALFVVGATSSPALLQARAAHEVPAHVTVRAFVKPEGKRLRLLVRVPLVAIRDVEFPLRGPDFLDLAAVGPALHDAARLWIAGYVRLYEGGTPLAGPTIAAARVSLPSDASFTSWERALAHVTGPPLPPETELPWQQALLDVLLETPIASDRSDFSIRPAWAHLGVTTVTALSFVTPDGSVRPFHYEGDPGLLRLDPRWHQAALRFIRSGFLHILEGLDHLLFLFCLVIPLRRLGALVPVVTAFTVAHSITLIASAAGFAPNALWFPPLVETLIALSIVYMALENIVRPEPRRRWTLAFGFGLVHGFGFSFLLRETLQFAGSHLALSLLSFNIGVELGQLFVLALVIPVLAWLFRRVVAERVGVIVLSALVAHTAWHWMTERGAQLLEYDIAAPALDALFLAAVMRWLMLALIAAGAAWLLAGLFDRWARVGQEGGAAGRVRR